MQPKSLHSYIFCLVFFLFSLSSEAQTLTQEASKDTTKTLLLYNYTLDLTKQSNDRVRVELIIKDLEEAVKNIEGESRLINSDSISFFFPKIVPGTYSIYDFGRFVNDLKAFDRKGNSINIYRKNENEWRLPIQNLYQITYLVDDTFDSELDNTVFEPGGTSIEKEVFVINTHGFFGYLDGYERSPLEINVIKPKGFYGSTSLRATKESTPERDSFVVSDYHLLADSPIMYCRPDTAVLKIGGADVLVSIYHQKQTVKAKEIAKEIKKTLEAQKNYLGGTLPIDKYAFLIYIFDGRSKSGAYGALEHSYSSLYFLPNYGQKYLAQTVVEISAHEFFHILTPLTIHSEQIHYFDFNKPEMSRHLWLYEGVTEYFANHVLLQQELIDLDEFLEKMLDKVINAQDYSDVPFTKMSLGCLDKYADEYGNVYEKGGLIAWMLDVRLRELSEGKYGLMNLMQDLSEKYGKDKPFKDDKLFDVITEMTYPEIRTFFADYVEGSKPLPYKSYLQKAGIEYVKDSEEEVFNFGDVSLAVDPTTKTVMILDTKNAVGFGKIFKKDDILLEINKKKVTPENILNLIADIAERPRKKVKILVERDSEGKRVLKKLKARPTFTTQKRSFGFEIMENPDEQQLKIRRAWQEWK